VTSGGNDFDRFAENQLICPMVAGYTSLINNLSRFAEVNALPRSINFEQMNDGRGVLATFTRKCAKYHKLSKIMHIFMKVGVRKIKEEKKILSYLST